MLETTTPVQDSHALQTTFHAVRERSLTLLAPLSAEDAQVQSMPDASPVKWHLAHTTWFFEQFLLAAQPGYALHDERYMLLFNSYYESVGPRHARARRGLLSRPSLGEVLDYRHRIDEAMQRLLADGAAAESSAARLMLGLQHEQQHQELMLSDIKHVFASNPLEPGYLGSPGPGMPGHAEPLRFLSGREGVAQIGHAGAGFAFDCETPRHPVYLSPHALANRPITNEEFRDFIRDGGYHTPGLWMSEGWASVQREGWQGPLYWDEAAETEFTLAGRQEIDPYAPVCHISYYEADAYARWAGARLPTEAEWESLASRQPQPDAALRRANFADAGFLHPQPAPDGEGPLQLFGDVWEWTASPYVAYPGFRPLPGALGEYNGKFMCGQWVLRGGSCATPAGHLRPSYRNFFYPPDRWQFMGLRLAKDL